MTPRRVGLLGSVAACTFVLALGGCGSDAAPTAASATAAGHSTGSSPAADASGATAGASAGGGSATGAPAPSSAPRSLAPAGPAPGGIVAEAGEDEAPAAGRLAASIDCVELEGQQHQPSVSQQVSCRRGEDRVYISTFISQAKRDTYLTQGPQVVPGGWNVVGASWVVHVEQESTANEIAGQLQGTVQPGT